MRGPLGRFAALLLALLLASCQTPRQEQVVFAIATAPASLHPLLATDAVSERINELLYRPLIEFDERNRPVPGIVQWHMRDPRHYELRLMTNLAPFSPGSEVRLDDVHATLLGARDHPASPHAGTLANLREVKTHQEYLLLVLEEPDPRFPEKLHLGVAPAALLDDPSRLAREPVGNGPFELLYWLKDGGVLLQRRRDGQRFAFQVVPDPTMRALKLLRGEASLVQNDLPYEMYPVLESELEIELQSTPGTTFSYLGFNLEDPVTGDRRIRAAIAHAIDRRAIVEHLFSGYALRTNTLLTAQHWAAHQRLVPYAHDPERARALLAEMGYSRSQPLHLSYKTSTDPFRLRVAAVLQAQLKEVGINLKISSNEWGTFFGDIKAGRFQMYSLSWVGIRTTDIFRHVFHSDSLPPGGANRGRYQSQEVDRLIDQASLLKKEAAKPLYRSLQEIIHRDLVYVPLWHEDNLLLSRGIQDSTPQRDGSYRFLEQVSLRNE